MKQYFFILFLLPLSLFGQSKLDSIFSKQVCDCLGSQNTFLVSQDIFGSCIMQSMEKDSALFIDECKRLYGDTSEAIGYKFGKEFIEKMTIKMVKDCKVYFQLMDSLRYQEYKNLNVDSLKNALVALNTQDESKRDENFYFLRADLNFKLKNYSVALPDIERITKTDEVNPMYLYLKAWLYEIGKNYDEAILLYEKIAAKTNSKSFYIFSEVAKRKKNGI